MCQDQNVSWLMLSRKCIKTGTDRKKTLKDQYIVYSKVSKANLVLKHIALITNSQLI